ncbi:MAG TPA: beta-propeller fold lactonase family protein [Acetobacteraceae bacterium]|nr:beta-propeller fold lactonase family protein [Acetobacteraceae bacterium]
MQRQLHSLLAATMLMALPVAAHADIVLSSNDGHTVQDDQKRLVAPKEVHPDTISIIDVSHYPPTITATVEVPGSVVGPPTAAWVAKDESWAIVTSATKSDLQAKDGIAPDDRVSVIDLTTKPPKFNQNLTSGLGATTVRVSPDGKLALIANRTEGTVSVFTVANKQLTAVGKVDLGNKGSLPSGIVFTHDGKHALLTRGGDNMVSVLNIDGSNVTVDPRPLTTGMAPYTMDINAAGTLAVVSNMGRGDGDRDSVSLIDLTSTPFRVVETVGVPSSPEPLKLSPDGKFLAVGAENGTTKPPSHPFHHDKGLLTMFAVEGTTLRKLDQAPIGPWNEAIAFSRDGRTILVQSMADREINVFRWNGRKLTPGKSLVIKDAGPESFATAWP